MTRILVVEPDPMVRRILADKLQREGYEITASSTLPADAGGYDAALIAGEVPAPVPHHGWLAICEADDPAAALAAVRAGAAGVVRKPFKPTAVAEQVRHLLAMVTR